MTALRCNCIRDPSRQCHTRWQLTTASIHGHGVVETVRHRRAERSSTAVTGAIRGGLSALRAVASSGRTYDAGRA